MQLIISHQILCAIKLFLLHVIAISIDKGILCANINVFRLCVYIDASGMKQTILEQQYPLYDHISFIDWNKDDAIRLILLVGTVGRPHQHLTQYSFITV